MGGKGYVNGCEVRALSTSSRSHTRLPGLIQKRREHCTLLQHGVLASCAVRSGQAVVPAELPKVWSSMGVYCASHVFAVLSGNTLRGARCEAVRAGHTLWVETRFALSYASLKPHACPLSPTH